MKSTYTHQCQIDTNDLKDESLPLTIVAEVTYDKFLKMRAAEIKSITMSVKTAHGSVLEVPMPLTSFRPETLNIFATEIEEKFDVAMIEEGA